MFRTVVFCGAVLFAILVETDSVRQVAACPQIKLKNGRIRYRQKGRFVKFQCNTGYILAGDKYSTCNRGEWDTPLPKCVRATCPKVNPPINGLIYPSHRGAVLNFFCKPEYELRGPNITYCDGRRWDNNLPSCIKSTSKPPLSCDFESEDLCGWTEDLRHDFDWIRINSKTPSGYLGTGPSSDHTKGEGNNGHYMYIESSSKNENDTARLISPIYDKTVNNTCFKFYYHMYGAGMGSLRIYLKKFNESWDFEPSKAVFNRSGNHGENWIEGFIRLGRIDQDFQIVIEGVNGPSYTSDLAIDDVQLIENCTDNDDLTMTTEIYETPPLLPTESCANRCDNDNILMPSESFRISCDCNELCLAKYSCCPDYVDICVIGETDESTTTYQTTRLPDLVTKVPRVENQTSLSPINKTKKIDNEGIHTNSVIPKDEVNSAKDKQQHFKNDSTLVPKKTLKGPILSVSTVQPTLLKNRTIVNLPPLKNASFPKQTKLTLPPLIFLTPSPTQPIVRKIPITFTTAVATILVTLSPKPSSAPKSKPPIYVPTSSSTTIKAPVRKTTSTESSFTRIIDEVANVPTKKVVEEVVTPIEIIEPKGDKEIDRYGSKELDVQYSSSNPKNAKIVIQKSKPDSKFIIVLVSSISIVLIGVICIALIVKRYSVTGCRRISRFKSSGDSQSDVRFLTSDEQLDFTLARADEYSRY